MKGDYKAVIVCYMGYGICHNLTFNEGIEKDTCKCCDRKVAAASPIQPDPKGTRKRQRAEGPQQDLGMSLRPLGLPQGPLPTLDLAL